MDDNREIIRIKNMKKGTKMGVFYVEGGFVNIRLYFYRVFFPYNLI